LVRDEGIKNAKNYLKPKGFSYPHYNCISENGMLYVSSIIKKYADGSFSTIEASSFLNLKLKSFDNLIEYVTK
jgi:hypothetical protein